MFIEFSEYIINTIWENEFDSLDLETLEPTSKPDRTPFKKDEHEKWKEEKKEVFFQIRTEEMFDKAKYIKSWKNLGMTDYNRRIYRLDFK